MQWVDLLFIHWPVEISAIRKLIPAGLEIDTFKGEAWIGLVPFGMRGVRPRFLPALPWISRFLELNVRTYVTAGDRPGVWFFSLDAANPAAVRMARSFFHLPYFNARMTLEEKNGWIHYSSLRTHPGAEPAGFRGRYRPAGESYFSEPGSLDHWLTARYCLYANANKKLFRGEIHHPPWPLQPAQLEIEQNTLLDPLGIRETDDRLPVLHFARQLDVVAWSLDRIAA